VSDFLKHFFRFAIFILIQVYVLNKIPHLHRFIIPYLYYLPLLWLPFSVSRMWLLIIGFVTGLTLDFFMMTPGLHAAACVLVAYVRPFVINILMDAVCYLRLCAYPPASWLYGVPGVVGFWQFPGFPDQDNCHNRHQYAAHFYGGVIVPQKTKVPDKYVVGFSHKLHE
jgi:hypothetical protein